MELSLNTSELLKARLDNDLAGKHIIRLKEALKTKDFGSFAEITMRESN